ncbi:MAG: isoleucine--tRNA ligase [Oscillospiraceae bacterium]|jgi:isoleucyl-tRNA synthetase|nr:isoleucine--tRNA ligase [Oscillospiraceae bacterium]
MAKDYNETLNLPKTGFPMRANLPQREPARLSQWEKDGIYYKLQEKTKNGEKYILHDGPPYANGNIHMGTALNKILKDIIIKYKVMRGYNAPYVPGWDCHGLPIELKALKKIGSQASEIDVARLRRECREFALSCLDEQKAQFKRLGVWGDFDNPYVTVAHDFEARQIEIFWEIYKKGFIYKGLKPVCWCTDCNTALAEAEIEYEDDECYSAFVKFPVTDDKGKFHGTEKTFIAIWTTTIWTLPGNLAISLGPEYEYTFIKTKDNERILVAKELAENVARSCGLTDYTLTGSYRGKDLEFIETAHPFLPRKSVVITGNHVTLESGTGCVHTAPGFGVEDYEVCGSYKGMFDIIVPVDEKGRMKAEAGRFAGMTTDEANGEIAADIKRAGLLLALEKITHSYPHCWRCRKPIIYRATDQWFCAVNKFADETLKAVAETKWFPEWGRDRMNNMVRDRGDWCISRQRRWGVPIPVLYCAKCGGEVINEETVKAISDMFRAESSDSWYVKDAGDFIPASVKCGCGCGEFVKELDIFDVWFDSGCTHAAVLEQRGELSSPCDLYLEGADQFRGWFQSSLLTCVAVNGRAPYRAVCAHGWVVDGKGEKMSKSKGNTILPEEIIGKYGADILRLWVASLDYHSDVRVSHEMLGQLSEVYRKIRNTARFMLGNLCNGDGFNPDTDALPLEKLRDLDKWALLRFNELIDKVVSAYEEMDYYLAYHALNGFCVLDMSNFYFDIIKDRLYCEEEKGGLRRSAQTAMYLILSGLTRLIAPILCFTADEIWAELPRKSADNAESVIFNLMPEKADIAVSADFNEKWAKIRAMRDDVLAALELKRGEKVIGKSLEAKVTLFTDDDLSDIMPELAEAFIVSQVRVCAAGGGDYAGITVGVTVTAADGEKCERCWTYSESVKDGLCVRCKNVTLAEKV